jgi:hypothetical protein
LNKGLANHLLRQVEFFKIPLEVVLVHSFPATVDYLIYLTPGPIQRVSLKTTQISRILLHHILRAVFELQSPAGRTSALAASTPGFRSKPHVRNYCSDNLNLETSTTGHGYYGSTSTSYSSRSSSPSKSVIFATYKPTTTSGSTATGSATTRTGPTETETYIGPYNATPSYTAATRPTPTYTVTVTPSTLHRVTSYTDSDSDRFTPPLRTQLELPIVTLNL